MRHYFLIILFGFVSFSLQAIEYKIDVDHSSVNFTIRHLVISKVKGKFGKFSGFFHYDASKKTAALTEATMDMESIDTGVPERDKHLRSPDFFDAKKHPTMTFKSTAIEVVTDQSLKVIGNLTLHGVTKPVILNVEIGGTATDPWGNQRAAFSASTKINRTDFGINWNKALNAGGVLIGNEVGIQIEIEGLLIEKKTHKKQALKKEEKNEKN